MKKILVVGDVILDKYVYGKTERVSPEAPIPILLADANKDRCVAGGAANVATNISASGVDVDIFSVVGEDEDGSSLMKILEENRVNCHLLYIDKEWRTISKVRYMGQNNQQILRVDYETRYNMRMDLIKAFFENNSSNMLNYSLIVISDYEKGFTSREMCEYLINLGKDKNIPVIVDVKSSDPQKYFGADIVKPNMNELSNFAKKKIITIEEAIIAAVKLTEDAGCKYVLATLGQDGMILVNRNGLIKRVKTSAREVYDVSGAGDTSIAYLASGLFYGLSINEAVELANDAAGVQVSKVGTSIVSRVEVEKFQMHKYYLFNKKVLDFEKNTDVSTINELHRLNKKIVFTNGCFDILHIGHITYLNQAKKLGDILVVGVNSDRSVNELKGVGRPINSEMDRMLLLAALECVDYVICFNENTPLRLIMEVDPDILVKGGDYVISDIVGYDFVKSRGGEVLTLPFVEGKSSTRIINEIKAE